MGHQAASAALLLAAFALPGRAQTAPAADSLPARPGTWALEAGVGDSPFFGGVAGVGALRFVGARSAVTLNLFGGYSSETRDQPSDFGDGTTRGVQAGANLGVRWYAPPRAGLAGFGGVGATGSYVRFSSGAATTRTYAGGFGELGAAYLVARRLAVNASTALTVVRVGGRDEVPVAAGAGSSRVRGWNVGAGGVRLSATLFF